MTEPEYTSPGWIGLFLLFWTLWVIGIAVYICVASH